MMHYVLVKFYECWADEFDVQGFDVMTQEEWKDYKAVLETYFNKNTCMEYYFGTNEALEWNELKWMLDCYKTDPLTLGEASTLKLLFPSLPYGIFPIKSHIVDEMRDLALEEQ